MYLCVIDVFVVHIYLHVNNTHRCFRLFVLRFVFSSSFSSFSYFRFVFAYFRCSLYFRISYSSFRFSVLHFTRAPASPSRSRGGHWTRTTASPSGTRTAASFCLYYCVCIYIYIYIHTYLCIYIYIYIHTHTMLCISYYDMLCLLRCIISTKFRLRDEDRCLYILYVCFVSCIMLCMFFMLVFAAFSSGTRTAASVMLVVVIVCLLFHVICCQFMICAVIWCTCFIISMCIVLY